MIKIKRHLIYNKFEPKIEEMSMNILAQERNYLPIDIETKYQCCLRRKKSKWSIKKILSYYHVKRSSLFAMALIIRWN